MMVDLPLSDPAARILVDPTLDDFPPCRLLPNAPATQRVPLIFLTPRGVIPSQYYLRAPGE